jgi:hypothetical protein
MKIFLYFHGFIHDLQKISVNSFSNVHENVNENHMKMKKFHIKEILSTHNMNHQKYEPKMV